MLWARTCKNQRSLSNLLFHIITRCKHQQIYFKGLQESVPHLDDQTPPQSRAEVNFVSFADGLLVKVVVASFGDAADANAHFSVVFLSWFIAPLTFQNCCRNAPAADMELQAPARHNTGEESGEGFGTSQTTPCSQVTHPKNSENKAKAMLGFMGSGAERAALIRPELMRPMLYWVISE